MRRFFVMVTADNEPDIEKQMHDMENTLRCIGASPIPWMLAYGLGYYDGPGAHMVYGYRIEANRVIGLPAVELEGSEEWR